MGNKLEKIRHMLCNELDEIADKGELSAGDLQSIHMLTDTVKNIDKIEYLEDDGYSMDGVWRASGTYPMHERYSNGRHSVRSHYSNDDGSDMMMHRIDEMLDNGMLPAGDREALIRAKSILIK